MLSAMMSKRVNPRTGVISEGQPSKKKPISIVDPTIVSEPKPIEEPNKRHEFEILKSLIDDKFKQLASLINSIKEPKGRKK